MKKIFLVICIVIIVAITGSYLLFLTNPMIALFFLPKPDEPQIKHAEFPFTLVYEDNGEKKTISDAIVCDYDGIEINAAHGKVNKWKSCIKSGSDRIVLWSDEKDNGVKKELCYYTLPAAYLLGNERWEEIRPICVLYTKRKDGNWYPRNIYNKKHLKRKYGIQILGWECSPPIENSFE